MSRALLAIGAGLTALGTTRALIRGAIPRAPLRRTNYRGLPVASGLGITVLAGLVGGAALIGVVYTLSPRSHLAGSSAALSIPLLALALGFGLLGLYDDLCVDAERGFRAHLAALRAGRMTGGGLKLLAGGALAVTIAAPESTTLGWAILQGALIAMFANVFNSFDMRPGRALKFFFIAAIPLAILVSATSAICAAAIGAAAGFLPDDLKQRAMLGDAGANALGALVGGAVVFAEPPSWFRLGIVALLVALTVVAQKPGFGALIEKFPPLRAFDRAGRVRELPRAQTAERGI